MLLHTPLIRLRSSALYDALLMGLVTAMYIALCAEADMYVPAFPQMIEYFGTSENAIQLILSVNFAGLCVAGLVAGPLSDAYGRRGVLLVGSLLFVVSSLGCVYAEGFTTMLLWRILQGIAASVPMVIGAATFLDRYAAEKAGQLVGILNGIVSASMAGAPILGAVLSVHFGWRMNFVVIFCLTLLIFLGTLCFIEESLPAERRKSFRLRSILKDYVRLASDLPFMTYSMIGNFPFVVIVVYISNLSVIFINHMGMSLMSFSYAQATTMGTFIVFSFVSAKCIAKKGMDSTKNLGAAISLCGVAGLICTGSLQPGSATMICLSMAVLAAGGALMAASFGIRALELFPDMKGTSLAMMTAIRQSLAAGLVLVSEYCFSGTIFPVAMIVGGYAAVSTLLYGLMIAKREPTAAV